MTAEGGSSEAAGESWARVSDALLRGVGHALNNRVAALSAVAQVLIGAGSGSALETALGSEADRLQRSVALLRLLPRRWEGEPEAARVEEMVGAALELLPLHYDLPEVRYRWEASGELAPVLVEPSLLTHILCVLGTAAARGADGAEVVFRGSGTAERVTVEVAASGGGGGVEIDALVERLGGELRVEEGGDGFRASITLPTLAAARRRGAGG